MSFWGFCGGLKTGWTAASGPIRTTPHLEKRFLEHMAEATENK
jgi:hypothetical protein